MQVSDLPTWQPEEATSSLETYTFQIAGKEFHLKTGEDCFNFLDNDDDQEAVAEHEHVTPWEQRWSKVTRDGKLQFHESNAKEQVALVEHVMSTKEPLLAKIGKEIMAQAGTTSKFLPFEDFLDHVSKRVTTEVVVHAVAIILISPRFKFYNNGVVVNEEGDILVMDDHIGWTEPAATFLSLTGVREFPEVPMRRGIKQFSYGTPTGCSYLGEADRAVVEGLPVQNQRNSHIQKFGISGDGRCSEPSYLIFRNYKGRWRKVYLEGNLMFVSGSRGRTITSRIPVKSLQVLGFGAEFAQRRRGLLVPTTDMFDEIVRTINKGNERLSMWFAPKVLTGRIACCRGPTVLSSYFRKKVDIPGEEFGPTVKVYLLRHGSELAYVVNVQQKSYLLAAPYDSHGFEMKRGREGYFCVYGYVPPHGRYLVQDTSNLYFGGS